MLVFMFTNDTQLYVRFLNTYDCLRVDQTALFSGQPVLIRYLKQKGKTNAVLRSAIFLLKTS